MFYDTEITDDLLYVSLIPPPITRQNATNNLLKLIDTEIDTEININHYVYRSISSNNYNSPLPIENKSVSKNKSVFNDRINLYPKIKRNKTF
jgi:hypothetical protein